MQVESFTVLLQKYKDFDTNPASETYDRIKEKFEQPFTTYYFIMFNGQKAGAMRLIYSKNDNTARISPMFVLPKFQNKQLGQKAVVKLEEIYNDVETWSLDTILQEEKLCHFYEKLGYKKTGRFEHIKLGMDIAFYQKLRKLKFL